MNEEIELIPLDGNKLNNRLDNLEYVTAKENTNRAWKLGIAKYTDERKEKLRRIVQDRWNKGTFRKWRNKKIESMKYKII